MCSRGARAAGELTVYTSEQCHYSVEKSLDILGLGRESLTRDRWLIPAILLLASLAVLGVAADGTERLRIVDARVFDHAHAMRIEKLAKMPPRGRRQIVSELVRAVDDISMMTHYDVHRAVASEEDVTAGRLSFGCRCCVRSGPHASPRRSGL